MTSPPPPFQRVRRIAWRTGAGNPARTGGAEAGERIIPEEVAVAISYNRTAYAVMMATPADLEDFALGFSLTEGVIRSAAEVEELEIVTVPRGIELRLWIAPERMEAVEGRHRRLAGPTGCGLCGLESLDDAMRPLPPVRHEARLAPAQVMEAMAHLRNLQALNRLTRAVHAAAFWHPGDGVVALREDVGRHNALDKLAGAMAREGRTPEGGAILLTSRISVELVQKAAAMGAPVLIAVSAPTALALRLADQAGITLAGIARDDGFEIFTHPGRILTEMVDAA